jgi:hypothetical protein
MPIAAHWERQAGIGSAQDGFPYRSRALRQLRGQGSDLPAVQPKVEAYVRQHVHSGRFSFQAGDFFADPLPYW